MAQLRGPAEMGSRPNSLKRGRRNRHRGYPQRYIPSGQFSTFPVNALRFATPGVTNTAVNIDPGHMNPLLAAVLMPLSSIATLIIVGTRLRSL